VSVDGRVFADLTLAYEQAVRVVEAARDLHDELCGCTGEVCDLGAALAEYDEQRP